MSKESVFDSWKGQEIFVSPQFQDLLRNLVTLLYSGYRLEFSLV
jgi:hypothetical protein